MMTKLATQCGVAANGIWRSRDLLTRREDYIRVWIAVQSYANFQVSPAAVESTWTKVGLYGEDAARHSCYDARDGRAYLRSRADRLSVVKFELELIGPVCGNSGVRQATLICERRHLRLSGRSAKSKKRDKKQSTMLDIFSKHFFLSLTRIFY